MPATADGVAVAPAGVKQAGSLVALFLDVARYTVERPFRFREFVRQAWFVASVTIVPTMMVTIPFGAVIALELGTLSEQIGAQSFTGAASVAIIREARPIVRALLIAGASGSPICADLGSGKIRDEIDVKWRIWASRRSSGWSYPGGPVRPERGHRHVQKSGRTDAFGARPARRGRRQVAGCRTRRP